MLKNLGATKGWLNVTPMVPSQSKNSLATKILTGGHPVCHEKCKNLILSRGWWLSSGTRSTERSVRVRSGKRRGAGTEVVQSAHNLVERSFKTTAVGYL